MSEPNIIPFPSEEPDVQKMTLDGKPEMMLSVRGVVLLCPSSWKLDQNEQAHDCLQRYCEYITTRGCPGESCDCLTHQVCTEAREVFPERFTGKTDQEIINEIAGVVQRAEKTAPSAANTEDGGAEHVDHAVSTFNNT